jgi:hypothetical protein
VNGYKKSVLTWFSIIQIIRKQFDNDNNIVIKFVIRVDWRIKRLAIDKSTIANCDNT